MHWETFVHHSIYKTELVAIVHSPPPPPPHAHRSISRSLIYPLVLISSETHHGNASNKLFPTSLLSELNIHTISFNPVAHTSLVKTLQRISTLECAATGRGVRGAEGGKFHMPPREVIERLAESSAGDVRSAVNALQFTCLRGKGPGLWLWLALHSYVENYTCNYGAVVC